MWLTVCRGTVSGPPRRTTTVVLTPCKLHSATDSPWDPHPLAPGSWEQTWQRVCPNWSESPGDAGESISASPFPNSSASLGAARRWGWVGGVQQVHTLQLTMPPSGSCLSGDPSSLPCFPPRAHSIHRTLEFSSGSLTQSSSITSVPHWQS